MGLDLATALAQRSQHVRTPASHFLAYVLSSTSTTVTLRLADNSTLTVPKLRSYSPSVSDVALVLKAGGAMYALGALNAAPVTPPDPSVDPDPEPPSSTTVRSKTFRPTFTGTYRNGWRGDTSALYQGDWTGRGTNYGAAYYGSGPGGLSGIAVSATVRMQRHSGGAYGGQSPTLRLLTNKSRPGGFPSYSKALRGPSLSIGESKTFSIPVSWAQALINGTAGGIGIGVGSSSPYIQLAGRGAWGPAMELTIRWKS